MISEPVLSTPAAPASTSAPWRVEGPLVISTVADWHRRFQDHVDLPREIDLSAVTAADVFGLQLLRSVQRTVAESGQPLRISAVSPVIHEACASAGMPRDLFQLLRS